MRVAENLNRALHGVLADDPGVHVLGEDITDPYGGAFKATRGLSDRFPDRVHAMPLSENAIVGVAGGLALAGDKAIVEIMFSDFVGLAFDAVLNLLSKSVTMYGRRVPMPVVVRCPTGGGRGYGPTHSQSLQKHFLGIPGLSVYEMSPFHEIRDQFDAMLASAEPCLYFEDKVLYTRPMYTGGVVDDLLRYELADGVARVCAEDPQAATCVVIAPGGVAHRAMAAIRSVLVEDETSCVLLVPDRLYPFDVRPLLPLLARAGAVVVAEESTAGGTWGADVAAAVHEELWGRLRRPVVLAHSAGSVVPAAVHLERTVLLQEENIRDAIRRAVA
ncbi:alpha-ketoacid dehydrogenase subunit beta [Dactylosporangium salmoneum]|uniref:Pyruvate dehydrogenase E1 component subunit beta n=1 Tax=Dactylosporangium salmoneum TaxID=53361 RepID=A0ABN3I434_9ACTN